MNFNLNTSIQEIRFSPEKRIATRTRYALLRGEILTLGELAIHTEEDLMTEINGFGKKCLQAVYDTLYESSLKLGMTKKEIDEYCVMTNTVLEDIMIIAYVNEEAYRNKCSLTRYWPISFNYSDKCYKSILDRYAELDKNRTFDTPPACVRSMPVITNQTYKRNLIDFIEDIEGVEILETPIILTGKITKITKAREKRAANI